MRLERITPYLGARVTDVDLTRFTSADRGELRAMLDEHQVLFFAHKRLTPRQFIDFAEVVGEVQASDESAPFVQTMSGGFERIHYVDVGQAPRGSYSDVWHSDVSFFEQPTYAALLQPETLPSLGGDTLWASMYAAYEALDARVRQMIDGLKAVHQVNYPDRSLEYHHPVVRVNPVTGRRALYVNRLFTRRIVGLAPVESASLLEMLLTHCTLPDFQLRFTWSLDTVVLWDNRFTLHYAVRDYDQPRRMIRTSTVGERPIGIGEFGIERRAAAA